MQYRTRLVQGQRTSCAQDDPALGRFLHRDPLGRAPLFFAKQPYVYAGNNPAVNVDPTGQWLDPVWSPDGKTLILINTDDDQPYAIDIGSYLASKGLQP